MTLSRGYEGFEVSELQKQLKDYGFNLDVDGNFGLYTEAAVRAFQDENSLISDGIVGPQTMEKLSKNPLRSSYTDPLLWNHPVPYLSQRNNKFRPSTTCNVTSLAMILSYYGYVYSNHTEQLEDHLYQLLQTPAAKLYYEQNYLSLWAKDIPINTVWGMLAWAAQSFDFKTNIVERTSEELTNFGKTIGPMLVSGKFTPSGHILIICGQTITKDFIVHDPWGNWNKQYTDTVGKFLIYPYDKTWKILNDISNNKKRILEIQWNYKLVD